MPTLEIEGTAGAVTELDYIISIAIKAACMPHAFSSGSVAVNATLLDKHLCPILLDIKGSSGDTKF